MKKPLLIEIGSEEIPARFISKGLELLKEALTNFLDESSISYGSISEFATPRRLALLIDDVAVQQEDTTRIIRGLPKEMIRDEDGNYTKETTGFFKSNGIDINMGSAELDNIPNITIEWPTKPKEKIIVRKKVEGRPSIDVLAEGLPKLISSLKLPKSMRWGDSSLRYFRPIQWLLALLDKEVIPFELDGIKSGNISYGHRFLSPAADRIDDPSVYLSVLKRNNVIANCIVRKELISRGIKKIESSLNCRAIEDEELLETVTNLVEHPTPVLGNFEDKYLSLPKELLITVMRSHQKYFAMEDAEGNITSSFIVISNMNASINDTVKRGAERVLRARFEDAKFYFEEDQKNELYDYTEDLKKVIFQEKLGSVFKKAERIFSLSLFIAGKLNLSLNEELHRASMLCKADLVTGVVGEFPELQGYMGQIYASNSNNEIDVNVSSSILEHYLPRFPGDDLPKSKIGTILSLADKLDNIASFFYLDMIPSGSEDPFALRRQAAGIIHILRTIDYPDSLNSLIDASLKDLKPDEQQGAVLATRILIFFLQRLKGILLSEGHSHDVIDAVLAPLAINLKDIKQRIDILTGLKKESRFPALVVAAKRVYNILKEDPDNEVNEGLFVEDAEKELFAAANNVKGELSTRDFGPLFKLEKPIDIFFDDVLVMDNDEKIRNNRLALLSNVRELFNSLGDFSRIVD